MDFEQFLVGVEIVRERVKGIQQAKEDKAKAAAIEAERKKNAEEAAKKKKGGHKTKHKGKAKAKPSGSV